HGIPIGHKDVIETAGVPTTGHSKALAGYVPTRDATVVDRLSRAGTTLLGKLTTYEFACGATPVYGLPINPWNPGYITGGSSAGSAAGVSAGLCFGATGTCTAGSIRVPSSFCGVVGLKPTYGLVSRAGVLHLSWSLDHVGPHARSVRDAALLLTAMAGHDPLDPSTRRREVIDYAAAIPGPAAAGSTPLKGVRLGVPRGFFDAPVQADVVTRITEAYGVLESLGAELVEVDLTTAAITSAALRAVMGAEATVSHRERLRERAHDYAPHTRRTVLIGATIGAAEYLRGQRLRERVRREFAAAMATVDAMVWPSAMRTAFAVDEPQAWSGQQTRLSNLTGTPSLSVPAGLSRAGLPIGLQINGRPFDEAMLFRVGAAFEDATDHHLARPDVRLVEPAKPGRQFAEVPRPTGASDAELDLARDDVRRGLAVQGLPLLAEDLDPLAFELYALRRDLDAAEVGAPVGVNVEPAVLQGPFVG
ncbi:MAG TPA: amidase, partial [Trueperaceae bacterium]|nr:amidase [Trueperaceae bacterium]